MSKGGKERGRERKKRHRQAKKKTPKCREQTDVTRVEGGCSWIK